MDEYYSKMNLIERYEHLVDDQIIPILNEIHRLRKQIDEDAYDNAVKILKEYKIHIKSS